MAEGDSVSLPADPSARLALLDHLGNCFPDRLFDELPGVEGPIESRVPGFRVFRIYPGSAGGW
ncbi:hypothetical protein [Actinoplanes sp. NPDC049681]|uniref:hypothetical protein n=1 Tax=Actinoplanes sp. NPDC049681 TaxID=3363905 RepID=UPI003794368B